MERLLTPAQQVRITGALTNFQLLAGASDRRPVWARRIVDCRECGVEYRLIA